MRRIFDLQYMKSNVIFVLFMYYYGIYSYFEVALVFSNRVVIFVFQPKLISGSRSNISNF